MGRLLAIQASAWRGNSSPAGSTMLASPGASTVTSRAPLRLCSSTLLPQRSSSQCCSAMAAARVAWPHRGTSQLGVNQRSLQCSPSRQRNAVSDWFNSAARACIQAAAAGSSSSTTAAPLPARGSALKASTAANRGSSDTGRFIRCAAPAASAVSRLWLDPVPPAPGPAPWKRWAAASHGAGPGCRGLHRWGSPPRWRRSARGLRSG